MSGIGDFIPPEPGKGEPVMALFNHLGYGTVLWKGTTEKNTAANVLALDAEQCRQLLYELTDDKRWLG